MRNATGGVIIFRTWISWIDLFITLMPRKRVRSHGPCRLDLYSLSGRTSYRKISWSLEAARLGFRLFQSFWNLTNTSAAALPRSLSNFRAIRSLYHPIAQHRGFARFGDKTSVCLVNCGADKLIQIRNNQKPKNLKNLKSMAGY